MTRGERNNDPGNLRLSPIHWQGEIEGMDKSFETFDTPEDGIRALAKLLMNYQKKYGLKTVRTIINRFAPSSENDTNSYVKCVSFGMGVDPDAEIDLTNLAILASLVKEIIRHENGGVIYSDATIASGIALV